MEPKKGFGLYGDHTGTSKLINYVGNLQRIWYVCTPQLLKNATQFQKTFERAMTQFLPSHKSDTLHAISI